MGTLQSRILRELKDAFLFRQEHLVRRVHLGTRDFGGVARPGGRESQGVTHFSQVSFHQRPLV